MTEALRVLETEAEQGFADLFEAAKATLPGADNPWVAGLRDGAMARYAAAGLPHRRIEEWKYTDLRASIAEAYPAPPAVSAALTHDDIATALGSLADLECHSVVIVNGQFRAELSDTSGIASQGELLSLSEALAAPPDWLQHRLAQVNAQEGNAVLALNTGFMAGGIALKISDEARFTKPVHLIHVHGASEPASLTMRSVIDVGAGAQLTIIESFLSLSDAPALTNAVTELHVGDGAELHQIKVQREGPETTHLSTWATDIGAEATYRGFQFSTGGKLARNQIFLRYAGEGADAETNGAMMLRGRQHVDTTLLVDHAQPGGRSREHFKAVLDNEARGILQCKVVVQRDAQKTDGHQMAQALLLSEAAEFDSKPELEIFADDVACGHGSTSGQIDEELLFYLRARGIPEPRARALLITAFVGEAMDSIENEPLREALVEAASNWLEERE